MQYILHIIKDVNIQIKPSDVTFTQSLEDI